jgi:hypothetical protein
MDVCHKEEYFFDLLKALRKRPGMYLPHVSVDSLNSFLVGYTCCNMHDGIGDFLASKVSFYDWIAMKESTILSPSMGWVEVLKKTGVSDEEEFKRFFLYLDEYLVREACVLNEYQPTSVDRNNCAARFGYEVVVPAKVQIVSYDKSVNGVFIRRFDSTALLVDSELHQRDLKEAYEYLNNTFMLNVPY